MTTNTKKKPAKAVTKKPELAFAVGSDPEFLLFNGNTGLNSRQIIDGMFKRNSKFSAATNGYKIRNKDVGNIGWDGAAATGEMRPKQEKSIEGHVSNIKALLTALFEELPFVTATTLSIGAPIGGHVHLEIPKGFLPTTDAHNEDRFSNAEDDQRQAKNTRLATKIIATFLMPIVASEHRISAPFRLRSSGGYGKCNDIRFADGGKHTAEIRGLTAEWLSSEMLAYATLSYLAVVWHEITTKGVDVIMENKCIVRNLTHLNALQNVLLTDFEGVERAVVRSLKQAIQTFELYPAFKDEVDFIMNPKAVMKHKKETGWNIGKGWGLESSQKKITRRAVTSEEKTKQLILANKVTDITNSNLIPFNDDYRVEMFSEVISERIMAHKWKLKKEYFFYGLKKGVTGFAVVHNDGKQIYAMPEGQTREKTLDTAQEMASRAKKTDRKGVTLDPSTGLARIRGEHRITIGIPYDVRLDRNFNEVAGLIFDIEEGKLTPKKKSDFPAVAVEVNKEDQDSEEVESVIRSAYYSSTTEPSLEDINEDALDF